MEHKINDINSSFEKASVEDIIRWSYDNFDHNHIKLSTSFGAEGIILINMMTRIIRNPKIFTIDTGRNFQETYDIWQEIIDRFDIIIDTYFPDSKDINQLIRRNGPNLFFRSIAERKQCCYQRKVKPLRKALRNADVWITGIRREQTGYRSDIPYISWSKEYGVYKICPLVNWTEKDVWEYIQNHQLPYNKLHDLGYDTIGCMPCTKAIPAGENKRTGRWWWENDNEKECGIHIEDNGVSEYTNDIKKINL